MSDLGFNKIAGAVLAAGLAITFMNQISEVVFEPKHLEECVDCPEPPEPTPDLNAAPVLPPDWGTVLPVADLTKGAAVFEKCKSCHKPTDVDDTGPGLLAVVGRQPGTHATFAVKYSEDMKAFGAAHPRWDYDLLEQFLTKPKNLVKGTKMTFPGLKKREDRINVIAYLHTLGSTLPIPAPDPSRQAPAEGAAPAAAAGAPVPGAAGTVAAALTKAPTPAAPGPAAPQAK